MLEPIHFPADLYRREALDLVARQYAGKARVELENSGTDVVARVEPLIEADSPALRDEFCTAAFSATVRQIRALAAADAPKPAGPGVAMSEPPWKLLAPFAEGDALGEGWVLASLSPVRSGATTMVLRHARDGSARVAIRRNGGAPLGIAHTDQLDFMLMNGGGGTAPTDAAIEGVLVNFAEALRRNANTVSDDDVLALLLPATDPNGGRTTPGAARSESANRGAPRIDIGERTVTLDVDESRVNRQVLYDALQSFTERCYVLLTRPESNRVAVQLKTRGEASAESLAALGRDVTRAIAERTHERRAAAGAGGRQSGLPRLTGQPVDLEALLTDLDAADAATIGLGFEAERGPGHDDLRVLNLRGTGACNSDCVFCVEKFNPTHRPMAKADDTRQLIADSAGQFDMLFFASGEPTIHPKLFDYVALAKSVGFTSFGMSSHFRTFADPRFALRTLQAGFEYFDISLHAADASTQLDVNPIGDDGDSLFEALKGLAVLYRLAEGLGIRISITHKIVVSRLNVTRLERIFRATYDRGVRHFILQPVRTLGLAPELQAKLAISEDGIMPHLNELLRRTEGLGAVLKPYGFSRQQLYAGSHVESEQNRVKNIYGKARHAPQARDLPAVQEERPTDGRHWVEVRMWPDDRFSFASTGAAPVLDDALQRGLDLPFGCRMGSCGMCCARLVEGRVDQSSQIFLTEEQRRDGFVLMCQARPLSDVVLQVCTDDEIDQL